VTARTRIRTIVAICGSTVLVLYLAAATCGRGGRGFFSPDTLECRTQSEWLIPLTRIPLYRGPGSTHRWPIVDYLVTQGWWAKADTSNPRWLPTFQWNQQWNDGESQFHRELGWRGDAWITWSNENPDMAKALWPKMLTALRQPGAASVSVAADLLFTAQHARSVEEFERLLSELPGGVGRR
jgi:hypothetical protein